MHANLVRTPGQWPRFKQRCAIVEAPKHAKFGSCGTSVTPVHGSRTLAKHLTKQPTSERHAIQPTPGIGKGIHTETDFLISQYLPEH
jgi:hypothetical protein